jgi:hypothetical protein
VRQQCFLANANWAAALWKAKGSTDPSFQNIEGGVECRVSGRHFEKTIVGIGHRTVGGDGWYPGAQEMKVLQTPYSGSN